MTWRWPLSLHLSQAEINKALWQSLEIQGSSDVNVWEGLSEDDIWAEVEGSERAGCEKGWEHLQAREQQEKRSWEAQNSVIRVHKVRGQVWR